VWSLYDITRALALFIEDVPQQQIAEEPVLSHTVA
jgi:hypothetical protein